MAMISARAVLLGRSTKKISSNRPLRINSGGRAEISFAGATTKIRERCSASQVRKVPSTRRDTPLSPSPSASAFSISSTQSTQGERPSAECSDSRRFFSASPCHFVYSVPKSKRTSGTPKMPAAAHAQQQDALGRVEARRAAVESRLAVGQPTAQVLHAADVGELGRRRLIRQGAGPVQKLVLCGEHLGNVVHGDGAMVENRVTHQPLCVRGG